VIDPGFPERGFGREPNREVKDTPSGEKTREIGVQRFLPIEERENTGNAAEKRPDGELIGWRPPGEERWHIAKREPREFDCRIRKAVKRALEAGNRFPHPGDTAAREDERAGGGSSDGLKDLTKHGGEFRHRAAERFKPVKSDSGPRLERRLKHRFQGVFPGREFRFILPEELIEVRSKASEEQPAIHVRGLKTEETPFFRGLFKECGFTDTGLSSHRNEVRSWR
jgi:hypothetical protein